MELTNIFLLALICIVVIAVCSVRCSKRTQKNAADDLNDVG